MNKKVIARILVALAAYGIFVALVVNFYDDSPAKMQWEDREAYNRQFIAKLELKNFDFNRAIEQLGSLGTHEALLALLDLVANTGLVRAERELALKRAREIVKSSD